MKTIKELHLLKSLKASDEYIHISPTIIESFNNAHQTYTVGVNTMGKPTGLWFAKGSDWLDWAKEELTPDLCCYLYNVVPGDRVLHIATDAQFAEFDEKYPSYWLHMGYYGMSTINYDTLEYISYQKTMDIPKDARGSDETYWQYLVRLGVVFLNPADAIAGCKFYRDNPENILSFKYKQWHVIASDYDGIYFDNWTNLIHARRNLWYQTLDASTGCIWNKNGIKQLTLTHIKRSPTEWLVIDKKNNIVNYMMEDTIADDISDCFTGGGDVDDLSDCFTGGGDVDDLSDCFTGDGEIIGGRQKDVQMDPVIVKTTDKLIPEEISECALYLGKKPGEVCASPEIVEKLREVTHDSPAVSPAVVVAHVKEITGKSTERDAITSLADVIGRDNVKKEISRRHKIQGPTDASLLSNINIDATLKQWEIPFPQFFAYNFNMRDYVRNSFREGRVVSSPDTLATVDVGELMTTRGKKTAACVINSDFYHGPGKHWMALFVDTRTAPATVEFFNSSGNAPSPEWINWLEKARNQLESAGIPAKIVRVSSIRHQSSRSECGVYSLFYIWARLKSTPVETFTHGVPDKVMFEFRQHLFLDPHRPAMKEFDWNEYNANTRIEWE